MNTKLYPTIPIRNTVVFPGLSTSLVIGRPKSVAALKEAQAKSLPVVIVSQKIHTIDDPSPENLYETGTLCKIESAFATENDGYHIIFKGISRFRVGQFVKGEKYLMAAGDEIPDALVAEPVRVEALFKNLKELASEMLGFLPPPSSDQLQKIVADISDPGYLTNLCAGNLQLSLIKKQELLEDTVVENRLEKLLNYLLREREVLKLQKEISEKLSEKLNKHQKDTILREQMRTIREELGEEGARGMSEISKKIKEAGLPKEIQKIADEELKKLESIPSASPEHNVIRSYLDWLAAMPWNKSSEGQIDLTEAERILNEDHYGLPDVKKRILEFLAVLKLKSSHRGSILCFVGPPGVGKTSLGQSIARALGRKFVKASLGGVRDESEIRGHRRTYIGSMPGRVIQSLKRAGVNNPVFMLDEIDKLGMGYQGDPASALLEVLDPEQNREFVDHYLDVPFDLSNVFFIATANVLDTIPPALRDRMEVIQLSGYTIAEKTNIAKKYLIPKQMTEHGLVTDQLAFSEDSLNKVVQSYTREAGVRNLSREIAGVCRYAARKIVGGEKPPFQVSDANLSEILGPEKFFPEVTERAVRSGVVTGLAWTPVGGEILFIEASCMNGTGSLTLTGQLGDVMKESAQIAMSIIRSEATGVSLKFPFDKKSFHLHVPSGAIPKDGPSAGVTMVTALASLISGIEVNPRLAMTGEITLRGAVLPVGGIKEKVMAAHRAGVTKIILPKRNQKDLIDVPSDVLDKLEFSFVETVEDVLQLALGLKLSDFTQIAQRHLILAPDPTTVAVHGTH